MSCQHIIKKYDDVLHCWKNFPCGHCPGCIADKTTTWALRCAYETLTPYGNSFLTLTYDDYNVPISRPFLNNFSNFSGSEFYKNFVHNRVEGTLFKRFTLKRSHLNTFIDSLNNFCQKSYKFPKLISRSTPDFKYFACGEYGDSFGRPHFHIAFFGLDFQEFQPIFHRLWKKGNIKSLPIMNGCTRYICKYFSKQSSELKDIFVNDYLEPPFVTSSKGLGSALYFDHASEILENGGFFHYGKSFLHCPTYWQQKIVHVDDDYFLESQRKIVSRYKQLKGFALSHGFSDVESYLTNLNFNKELEFNQKQFLHSQPVNLEISNPCGSISSDIIKEALL